MYIYIYIYLFMRCIHTYIYIYIYIYMAVFALRLCRERRAKGGCLVPCLDARMLFRSLLPIFVLLPGVEGFVGLGFRVYVGFRV